MAGSRRNERLVGVGELAFIHDIHALLLEVGNLLPRVGDLEGQVMDPLAMPFQKRMEERLLAERLQQLDRQPAHVEFENLVAGLGIVVLVKEARAEGAFIELAGLGGAFDRNPDMVELAERFIRHRVTHLVSISKLERHAIRVKSRVPTSPGKSGAAPSPERGQRRYSQSVRSERPACVETRPRLQPFPPRFEVAELVRDRVARTLVVRQRRDKRDVGKAELSGKELAPLQFVVEILEMLEHLALALGDLLAAALVLRFAQFREDLVVRRGEIRVAVILERARPRLRLRVFWQQRLLRILVLEILADDRRVVDNNLAVY